MLVLRLLILNFDFLLDQFVTFSYDFVSLLFRLLLSSFKSIFDVLDLLRQILVLQLLLRDGLLRLPHGLLLFAKFLPDLCSEVDVANPLFHHEVYRVDGLLNILWLCAEEVAYRWDPVALLRLLNVPQVVHEVLLLEL